MRKFGSPALSLTLVALLLILGTWSVHRYRYRFIRSRADLLRYVSQQDASTAFLDVSLLRQSGYLSLLAGKHNDSDYTRFVRETNFDYTKDLDAVAGSWNARGWTIVAQGRFDWGRLKNYAGGHPAKLRLAEIQPDTLVLGSSSLGLSARSSMPAGMPSSDPVWVHPSPNTLKDVTRLPAPARIFALALQASDDIVLSLAASATGAAFDLKLRAKFVNPAAADTASRQLEIDTKLLNLELRREGAQANRADLTGLLTAGAFSTVGNELIGTWPVRRELLNALR